MKETKSQNQSSRGSINESELSGYLQIKRKIFWVIRYCEIVNGSFYYYYNKGDSNHRGVFQLLGANVTEIVSNNEQIIQFTANKQQDHQRILIRCDKEQDHKMWLERLRQNHHSQSSQVIQNSQSLQQQNRNAAQQDSINFQLNSPHQQSMQNTSKNMTTIEKLDKPHSQQIIQKNKSFPLDLLKEREDTQEIRKQKKFILDNQFLLNESESPSHLALKKNLQTAFETCFNDSSVLCDIDYDIRLFCNEVSLESKVENGQTAEQPNHESPIQFPSFKFELPEFLESNQMKAVASLCALLVLLILYQSMQLLNITSFFLSVLILINLIALPLLSKKFGEIHLSSKKRRKAKHHNKTSNKRLGLKAEVYFSHNLNEFLFALTKCVENRTEWQLGVLKCSRAQQGEIAITYKSDQVETISQNVFRDGSTLYITESHSTNHSFLRIFQVPLNTITEGGFYINYFFYSLSSKISEISQSNNSPTMIRGLSLFIDRLKRTPTSSLFSYYRSLSDLKQIGSEQVSVIPQSQNQNPVNVVLAEKKEQKVPEPKQSQAQKEPLEEVEEEKKEDFQQSPNLLNIKESNGTTTPNNLPIEEKKKSYLLDGELGVLYNKKIEDSVELIQKVSPLTSQNNWRSLENKPENVTHMKIDEQSGNVMSRGEATIKKSVQQIVDFIKDSTKRKEWDESFKDGRLIQQISEETRIEYNLFKGIFPVSDRDMVLIQTTVPIDKMYYIVASSIEHPSVPQVKKPVRGTLKIGGWIITPKSERESNCIYITCANLNGNIPQAIKDMVAKQQANSAFKLKKAMEKK